MSLNQVQIEGRLGADPRMIQGPKASGAELRLAVWQKNPKIDNTVWVKVVGWGERFTAVSSMLKKSDSVVVSGELSLNVWEKDGVRHQDLYVCGRDVYKTVPPPRVEPKQEQESPGWDEVPF